MNNIVRAFVIALTLTAGPASPHTSNIFAGTVAGPKTANLPVPMCPPSDPNGCGIGDRK